VEKITTTTTIEESKNGGLPADEEGERRKKGTVSQCGRESIVNEGKKSLHPRQRGL